MSGLPKLLSESGAACNVRFALVLALVTLAVYWPLGDAEFLNYDDQDYVTDNATVQDGLSLEGVKWAFADTHTGNWHPVTWLSHMLDCQLFGMDAGAHHLTNVVLHLCNALLLFAVFLRMTGAFGPSAVVASLFALHPMNVESVAWIAERKQVLSGSFWMLTMFAYVRYVEKRSTGRYLWVVLALTAGLITKPLLVTLPFVLLLLDYWPLGRFRSVPDATGVTRAEPLSRLLLEKVPLFALIMASSVVTFLVAQSLGAVESTEKYSVPVRVGTALVCYVGYVGKLLVPVNLSILYPHPGGWPLWQVLGALAILVTVSLVVLAKRRSHPYLLTGWFWFLGTLVPMIGLVQVSFHSMANRYAYVSAIGLFLMAAWGGARLVRARPQLRIGVVLAAVSALAACALVSAHHVRRHWTGSISVWTYALAATGDNPIAHYNLGQALSVRQRPSEALPHYREAIRLDSEFGEAHANLGLTLAMLGHPAEAVRHYELALEIYPELTDAHYNCGNALLAQGKEEAAQSRFREAVKLQPGHPFAHLQLALILGRQGRVEEALAHHRASLAAAPDYPDSLLFYGSFLQNHGRSADALDPISRLVRLQPESAPARAQLALILQSLDRPADAIRRYEEALHLQPDLIDALNNLAWLLATHPDPAYRDGARAEELADKACRLTGRQQPVLLGTLAAAQAEAGQFPEAVATALEAAQLAEKLGMTSVAATNQSLLRLYKEGKAFRNHSEKTPDSP